MPNTSLRDHLIWEMHVEGLAGQFSHDKTIILVAVRFYCSSAKRDGASCVTMSDLSGC